MNFMDGGHEMKQFGLMAHCLICLLLTTVFGNVFLVAILSVFFVPVVADMNCCDGSM